MGNGQPKGFIARTPVPDKKHRNFKFDYKEGFSKKPTLPPELAKIEAKKEAKAETTEPTNKTTAKDNNNQSSDQKTNEEPPKKASDSKNTITKNDSKPKKKVPKTEEEKAEAAAAKLIRVRQISGFHMQLAQNLIAPKNKIKKISAIFQYVRTLGKGATGRVLQVIYKKNQKTYALKELLRAHPRNSKLFVREVVILRQLSKINGIMQIYDTFMDKYV